MKKILQYQKLDMDLKKIQRAVNTSQEKEIMNKMISYVKEAQNVSNGIENKASKVVNDYTSLKKNYEANAKKVEALTANLPKGADELKSAYAQINTLSSELFMIERNLNILIGKAKDLLKEFEVTKNNVIKARSKHKVSKENYEKLIADNEPKIAEIRAQMKSLEKEIDSALLEKYKAMKNDNIFPVYVPLLEGKACHGCRMEVASSKLNKLSTEQFITCEHCGRLIFKPSK